MLKLVEYASPFKDSSNTEQQNLTKSAGLCKRNRLMTVSCSEAHVFCMDTTFAYANVHLLLSDRVNLLSLCSFAVKKA